MNELFLFLSQVLVTLFPDGLQLCTAQGVESCVQAKRKGESSESLASFIPRSTHHEHVQVETKFPVKQSVADTAS